MHTLYVLHAQASRVCDQSCIIIDLEQNSLKIRNFIGLLHESVQV